MMTMMTTMTIMMTMITTMMIMTVMSIMTMLMKMMTMTIIGSLRSTTATVDENVTSKYKHGSIKKVFRDYLVSFTSFNMGELSKK